VAEVDRADPQMPLDGSAVAAIHGAPDHHAVLVFHGQAVIDEQQIAFTGRCGRSS
jgi:hypothetical protein